MTQIPNFGELLWPLVEALREMGGSGTNAEIDDAVIDRMGLTEEQLSVLHKGGPKTQVEYLLGWARTFLKKGGLATNSGRGIWALTEKGRSVEKREVEAVRAQVNRMFRSKPIGKRTGDAKQAAEPVELEGSEADTSDDWKGALIQVLFGMKPDAFERLAQRLLREVGVQSLVVTGSPGDGGIDGYGKLYTTLFSTRVFFQCKRWRGVVGPAEVRDFRGAMQGRGERGLLITTGTFSREAEKEAEREGATPVDLIDGERLCGLLKDYKVGVTTETVESVQINESFFREV